MEYYHTKMRSPVGELNLIATDKGLAAVLWERDNPQRTQIAASTKSSDHPILQQAIVQLNEYFEKKRTVFSVPLDYTGTEFQQQVWAALLTIPFGETRTYGQIAKQINNPLSVRAVGGAANKNPVSIIIPCHRVIGMTGKLIGFAGGLENKSCLLQIENKTPTLWDLNTL